MTQKPIALAMTGASGAQYGLRLLHCLLAAQRPVYLMLSDPARTVLGMETDWRIPKRAQDARHYLADRMEVNTDQLQIFGQQQWTAPVASGSAVAEAMVVCPCTTGTLASIAAGTCDNLIHRAADVSLKEQKKLVLVVRETPFSAIHLRNMLSLAEMGAVIMPANPGFYNQPTQLEELIDFMVARILDHINVDNRLSPRWGLST